MRHKLATCCLALALVGLCFQPALARAQLMLTITPLQQPLTAGSSATFKGVLTNNSSAEVFINGDSFSLPGSGLTLDDAKFTNNAPLSLTAGEATPSFPLFDVHVGPAALPGRYTGTFTVKGGASSASQDALDTESFIVVVGVASSVPEPNLQLLFASITTGVGLFGLYTMRTRTPKRL